MIRNPRKEMNEFVTFPLTKTLVKGKGFIGLGNSIRNNKK